MNECLDEQTILAFGRGQVPLEKRRPIEKHIATCDECRSLVTAIARSSFVDPEELLSPSPPSQRALPLENGASGRAVSSTAIAAASPVRGERMHERTAGVNGEALVADAPLLPPSPAAPHRRPLDKRLATALVVLLAALLAVGALVNASRH